MALFKVNTGCRNREVCGLHWEWEVAVPELETSVFIVPGNRVKNGDDWVIVLNQVAHAVVESVRGEHPEYVFAYRGRRLGTMHNTAWQSARRRAGLPQVRVHDLKHTFGRRLRAAGVSFEDRQDDLLGHRSGTARDASPRTTRRRNFRTCWKPRIGCAGRGPAKLPHWSC
jgi:integrase